MEVTQDCRSLGNLVRGHLYYLKLSCIITFSIEKLEVREVILLGLINDFYTL